MMAFVRVLQLRARVGHGVDGAALRLADGLERAGRRLVEWVKRRQVQKKFRRTFPGVADGGQR